MKGYTNWETYTIATLILNDQAIYDEVTEALSEHTTKPDKIDALKTWVTDRALAYCSDLAQPLLHDSLSRIDYPDLYEGLI